MRIAKPIPDLKPHDVSRFWLKVRRGSPDKCWEWTAARADGYGRFKMGGALYGAHRVAYQIENGPIPKHLEKCVVMHECDNPACCNPAHLKLGTGSENNRDAVRKGRWGPVAANLPHRATGARQR